jgi:hypothetical protein
MIISFYTFIIIKGNFKTTVISMSKINIFIAFLIIKIKVKLKLKNYKNSITYTQK